MPAATLDYDPFNSGMRARRYSLGAMYPREHVLKEVHNSSDSVQISSDRPGGKHMEVERTINDLYSKDLSDLAEDSKNISRCSAFDASRTESTVVSRRSSFDSTPAVPIGKPLATKATKATRPKLTRSKSSDPDVFESATYDLYAAPVRLDLHAALVAEHAEQQKRQKTVNFVEPVVGPEDWLKQSTRHRRRTMLARQGDSNDSVAELLSAACALPTSCTPAQQEEDMEEQLREASQLHEVSTAVPMGSVRRSSMSERSLCDERSFMTRFHEDAYVAPEEDSMTREALAQYRQRCAQMQLQLQQQQQQMAEQMAYQLEMQRAAMQQQIAGQMAAHQQQMAQQLALATAAAQQSMGMAPMVAMPMAPIPMAPIPMAPMHGQAGSRAKGAPRHMGSNTDVKPGSNPDARPFMPSAAASTAPSSVLAMAFDQEGSLKLQRALGSMPATQLQNVIEELSPHLGEMCTHIFGNYLVSKLVLLAPAQPAVAEALRGHVVELVKHAQGSRVMQAAFDALPRTTVTTLIDELRGHVAECAVTTNGSWSIVAAFQHSHAPFLVEEVAASLEALSKHQHGTRVVQRMLLEAAAHGVDVHLLLDELLREPTRLTHLAVDIYANYIVQHALRAAPAEYRARLLELLVPALPLLSTSKGGSNVAELVLKMVPPELVPQADALLRGQELETHVFGRHVIAALKARHQSSNA